MADVQVELKEETKAENGTKSAEAVLLRTGTMGAKKQQVSPVSKSGPPPQRAEIARRGPRRPGAPSRTAKAPAQGTGREDARSEEKNCAASGGAPGSGQVNQSTHSEGSELTEAAEGTVGMATRQVAKGEGELAESLLVHARSGRGSNGKLVLVDLAKLKKPRGKPVKKPRRVNWARQWAAEPEWKAPEEGS